MRRLLLIAASALLLYPLPLHAAGQSVTTVRGNLTVSCARTGKNEGQYRYALNGKPIAKLSSDCVPGLAETHIFITRTFASPASTALVVLEGMNAYSDVAKLIFLPKAGPASSISTITMSDDPEVTRRSPTAFGLRVPTGGYAIDMNHLNHWTCLIDVDFAKGTARGWAATPHEKRLPAGVCQVKVYKAPL